MPAPLSRTLLDVSALLERDVLSDNEKKKKEGGTEKGEKKNEKRER